jgi:AhpD family alkylhydroperoxidase
MNEQLYPKATNELSDRRRDLAPDVDAAFRAFTRSVFREGSLPRKTKELIAVAVAHVTQCPYCIRGHTRSARRSGATPQEIMEASWVAAEMRSGAAFAHATLALEALEEEDVRRTGN